MTAASKSLADKIKPAVKARLESYKKRFGELTSELDYFIQHQQIIRGTT